MSLRCVVGNCTDPEKLVERRYWGVKTTLLEDIEDHAYLDLCYFHAEVFKSRTVHTFIEGWDRPID